MRRPFGPAFLLAAMSMAACQRSPTGGPANPAPSPAALSVHDETGNAGPLRLSSLARLRIDSAYAATPGRHTQRIDVIDPHGTLYGPIRSQVDAGADGAVKASQGLEVAGTTIEKYHMVGTWQFVLVLDDGPPLVSSTIDITD